MDETRREGVVFWAVVLLADLLTHGRRRKMADIAEDAGIPPSTIRNQLAAMKAPYPYHANRLLRVAGVPPEVVGAMFTGGRIVIDVSEGTLTAESDADATRF